MGISINDLSEKAQKQALRKLGSEWEKDKEKRSKYGAKKTEVNGIVFDSKKEAERYKVLYQLWEEGIIRNLHLQESFVLMRGYRLPDGERIKPIIYKADFTYEVQQGAEWKTIIEDVKGKRTQAYLNKRKMMMQMGYRIKEV